jgi:hypothetical protein
MTSTRHPAPRTSRHHQPGHSPPPHPPLTDPSWRPFLAGYEAGIIHGIGMGRAQVSQEHADAATFPNETPRPATYDALAWAREGLSRTEWINRQKAEHAARQAERYARIDTTNPPKTAAQIRENAFASWGISDQARTSAA